MTELAEKFVNIEGIIKMDLEKLHDNLVNLSSEELISVIMKARSRKKSTMFHCIATGGHVEMLDVLSEKEFTADQWLSLLKEQDQSGKTAMHVAASNGHSNVLSSILKKLGKDGWYQVMSVPDYHGDTALHLAVKNKSIDAAVCICDANTGFPAVGHNILYKIQNNDKQTAAHLAAINNVPIFHLMEQSFQSEAEWFELMSIQDKQG